jgi:hypothetical protein
MWREIVLDDREGARRLLGTHDVAGAQTLEAYVAALAGRDDVCDGDGLGPPLA